MGENLEKKILSRRDVLKTAGKATAGLAVASVVPSILTACAQETEVPSKEVLNYEYMEASEDAPTYPYPYQKLDVETVKERAYAGFFNKGGCCRAVIDGVIGELADKTGYPFNQIPIDAFANGAGGYGAGSLCGSMGGSAFVLGLVCPPEDASKLFAEMAAWYTSTEMPIYQPEVKNETVVAKSIDCKDSVGVFVANTGYAMADPERKARCAGVAADCAGKTVELINNYYNL